MLQWQQASSGAWLGDEAHSLDCQKSQDTMYYRIVRILYKRAHSG